MAAVSVASTFFHSNCTVHTVGMSVRPHLDSVPLSWQQRPVVSASGGINNSLLTLDADANMTLLSHLIMSQRHTVLFVRLLLVQRRTNSAVQMMVASPVDVFYIHLCQVPSLKLFVLICDAVCLDDLFCWLWEERVEENIRYDNPSVLFRRREDMSYVNCVWGPIWEVENALSIRKFIAKKETVNVSNMYDRL